MIFRRPSYQRTDGIATLVVIGCKADGVSCVSVLGGRGGRRPALGEWTSDAFRRWRFFCFPWSLFGTVVRWRSLGFLWRSAAVSITLVNCCNHCWRNFLFSFHHSLFLFIFFLVLTLSLTLLRRKKRSNGKERQNQPGTGYLFNQM